MRQISLKVAEERGLKSIAFPAISSGIFGFPIDRCARIMLNAAVERLRGNCGLERVVFCLYGADAFEVFREALRELATPD